MKLTLAQVANSIKALNDLMQKDFKPSTVFDLVSNIEAINSQMKVFEDSKKKIIEKYNITEESTDDDKQAATKDVEELLNKEVEVDIKPISKDELGNISLTPFQVMNLKFMFKD